MSEMTWGALRYKINELVGDEAILQFIDVAGSDDDVKITVDHIQHTWKAVGLRVMIEEARPRTSKEGWHRYDRKDHGRKPAIEDDDTQAIDMDQDSPQHPDAKS